MALTDVKVPGKGSKNARIMLVGEGPGRNEARNREPFVGRAGGLLDDLHRAAGIERYRDSYITNVTKYLPNTKDKDSFFFQRGNPTKIYMEGILELIDEIKEVSPNIIGCFGKYALWALTQHGLKKKDRITNWRGSIMESTLVEGMKVIPMIHPSWYQRGNMNKVPLLEWDFKRVVAESKTPEIVRPEAEFVVNPTSEQIRDAIEAFTDPELDFLVVDTEWYNPNHLAYIGFATSKDYAVCIPSDSMLAYRAYKEILSSPIPKVMQNAMFDVVALDRVGVEVKNPADDTMIEWHSCFMDLGEKGLDTIASVLTRWPYYKSDVEFIGGEEDEKGQEYCCTDCVVTVEAHEKLKEKEFQTWGGEPGYNISISIMDTFLEASKLGIRADLSRLDELKEEYLQEADRFQDLVEEEIGRGINCRSWQQVQPLVYDELGYGSQYKTRSTAQDKLMDIAAADDREDRKQLLTNIIRVRQNLNMVSRYINRDIVDRDGRIRCTWNLAGTRNGRLSTTEPWWNGVAIQTVPYDAREVFIADPGHVFIGWDQEQAEARVVAIKTRDYDLLDAMNAGMDIHSLLGAEMGVFEMSYEEFQEKVATHPDGKDMPERFLSKTCRHALNYYGTWYTLKKSVNEDYLETGIGIDAATAKNLHEAYLEASPGLEAWWEEVYRTMLDKKYLVNALGRRRNFFGSMKKFGHLHRDGIAFYPQSTIADSNTQAIAEIDETPWITPLIHMHDGGLLQVPEEREEEAIELVKKTMTREIIVDGELLEIPIEVKRGYNWKDLKTVA